LGIWSSNDSSSHLLSFHQPISLNTKLLPY
jgi:hypothetical protein